MKIYRLNWTFPNNPIVQAKHKWSLPGVKCAICGETWGAIGCEYSAIDLTVIGNTKEYEHGWPVPLEKFDELKRRIRPLLPNDRPLYPGAEFGTLVGRVFSEVGDFAWFRTMTPLITNIALDKLIKCTNLQCVSSEVIMRRNGNLQLFVLNAEPRATIDENCFNNIKYCSGCGNNLSELIKPLVIKKSSIPNDVDLFRICWHTTGVYATERFADAVYKLRLTDIGFEEVQVSK